MQRKTVLGALVAAAAVAATALGAAPAGAIDFGSGSTTFSLGGFVQTGNSVRVGSTDEVLISITRVKPKRLLLQQNKLRLGLAGSYPSNVASQLTLDFYYTSQPDRPFDDRGEAEVDEAYLDFASGSVYVRGGKEKVIWGKSDLISPFDILTSRDVKDPFVNDTLQDRIGQWGVKLGYNGPGYALETVFIPVWTRSKTPEASSFVAEDGTLGDTEVDAWFPPIGILPSFVIPIDDPNYQQFVFLTTYERTKRPDKDLGSASFGTKLNVVRGRFDTDFYYVTAIDPLPHPELGAFFVDASAQYQVNTLQLEVNGKQRFSRIHAFGGATSTTWGRLALREELAFTQGSFWYRLFDEEQVNTLVNDFNQTGVGQLRDTFAERFKFQNIIGADYEISSARILTSTQLSLSHGFGHKEEYFSKANEVSMSNAVRRPFLDNHFSITWTDLINFSGGSVWMRPGINFSPPAFEDLEIKAAFNIFTGKDFSYVGQYSDNSSFVFAARLLF